MNTKANIANRIGPLVAAIAGCMTVSASAVDWPIYVAPGAYFSRADSARHAGNDYGLQFAVGTMINDDWSVEGVTESTKYRLSDGSGYLSSHGFSVQGLYNVHPFVPEFPVQPFLLGGAGWLQTNAPTNSYQTAVARGGFGFLWNVPDTHLDLRTDAVYRHEFSAKPVAGQSSVDFGDYLFSMGLSYRFGAPLHSEVKPQTAAPASLFDMQPAFKPANSTATTAEAKPEATFQGTVSKGIVTSNDQDGDGVDDVHDKCPDTPPGAVIDGDGCIIYMKKP